DQLVSPEEFELNSQGDYSKMRVAEVYKEYQTQLRRNNALDFDDLIMKTVELFQSCPEVLESYQERFRYIMVDEYQDTNLAQFQFVSLLASKYQNLCVVGDDDQSIYKFRGANIENILGFERVFSNTKAIRLEQNYRSTKNILQAANEVIQNNAQRKPKTLWTDNEEGNKVHFRHFLSGFEEAEYVVGDIAQKHREGICSYRDCAVLYRTNAQSRLFEEKFLMANIPYRLVGGVNFYARKEIKDLLSYLKTVDNAKDDLAVRRIINIPKRGIGATTLSRVQEYATEQDISFYDALKEAEKIPKLGRAAVKIQPFVTMIQSLRSEQRSFSVSELLDDVIERTGYVQDLIAEDTDESRARIENIDELITKATTYDKESENPTLGGFLEEVALVADIDTVDPNQDHVLLMTLHSAKGLEFSQVYLAGMEDGIFPSYMTIGSEDPGDMEEERRLCYVGITRAMKDLTMTSVQQRMIRGQAQYNKVSRFIYELPREVVDMGHKIEKKEIKTEVPRNNTYAQMREAFRAKAFQPRQFEVKKADKLSYEVGDTVRHVKFGVGIVKNIVEGGKDYEVTVDFDQVGVKKMFASFAKLKKI
ncbi:MAG: ATP-dependent helicase, partial [Blautia hydrogenotrophica]